MRERDDRIGFDQRVTCKRLGRHRPVDEHLTCPYCFGDPADIASGKHVRFCDFEPGVDPICFGFPETGCRRTQG